MVIKHVLFTHYVTYLDIKHIFIIQDRGIQNIPIYWFCFERRKQPNSQVFHQDKSRNAIMFHPLSQNIIVIADIP